MQSRRVLAVATSVGEYKKVGYRTGLWLSELTHFWDVLTEAGYEIDLATPMGGDVPLDPEGLTPITLAGSTRKHYQDRAFMDHLRDTRNLDDVVADDYDAIYLTGGHGTMFDFAVDERLAELVGEVAQAQRVVSAVCHGPAGLLNAKVDGQPLLAGKNVTGFSMLEEKLAQRADAIPFSLEDRLRDAGATYEKAPLPMTPHVVTDGRLVTGQNPVSAKAVGRAVVELLQGNHDGK
ncbi:MAG TPA: type 1 glutamine amidotransferase domain-containing protein [Candidatus Luteococcus avicola]|nr:type 1 glutamine amidotransferase domain-containing protein [Candidatus Luteococcus avicola]